MSSPSSDAQGTVRKRSYVEPGKDVEFTQGNFDNIGYDCGAAN
jgi:hypothetical protein